MKKIGKIVLAIGLMVSFIGEGGVFSASVSNDLINFQIFPEKPSYAPGEKVVLHLVLENLGNSTLDLMFPTSQIYDIQISGPASYFWRWSHGRMFAQVVTTLTIEPGEKKEFTETWPTEPSFSPGKYEVLAWLVCPDVEKQATAIVNLSQISLRQETALISDPAGCMILVRIPDDVRFEALKTMFEESQESWVGGKIEPDPMTNPPWSFYIEPETLNITDKPPLEYQAIYLRTIESNLDYWTHLSSGYFRGKVVTLYEKPPFQDIENNWAYPVILMLNFKGIINGFPDGNFYPERTLTRAEFVKMLFISLNPPIPMIHISNPTFSDVPFSYWASGYIENAVLLKWIKGFPDGTFRPDEPLTKEQVLTILARAAGWIKDDSFPSLPVNPTFPDIPRTHWAFPYVEIAVEKGLIHSRDPHLTGDVFGVGTPVLRNQTCLILVRFLFFEK